MVKKSFAMLLIVAGAIVFQIPVLFAQAASAPQAGAASSASVDQDVQLLREDLRSEKKQIIAANLQLTDAEATKFWPLYDAYSKEVVKFNDQRYALIKEYAKTYDTMTDAQAKSLIKRWGGVEQSLVNLRMEWMPKFEQVLPGKKAALYFQLDHRIDLLMSLQLASNIPLVKQ